MDALVIKEYEDFLALKEEWNSLIDRMDNPEIFYLHEWAKNYILFYEPDLINKLLIICVRDNKSLVAVFPFAITEGVVTFINRHTSDYNNIYIDKNANKLSVIKKGLNVLIKEVTVNSFSFANIPSSSELYFLQEALRENDYSAFLQESVMTPYFESDKRIMDRSQKKHIKDIERREGKLKKEKCVEYKHNNEVSEEEWEFLIQFKMERYKDAIVSRNNVQEFYKGIIRDMSSYVLSDTMYVDSNLSAVHLGFIYKGKVYYYMPTFNQGDNGSGFGLMLLKNIIETVEYSVFDSLIGNERYKFYWCNETSMNYHLVAYKRSKETMLQGFLISMKNTNFVRRIFGR